jgi:hypothetical protein
MEQTAGSVLAAKDHAARSRVLALFNCVSIRVPTYRGQLRFTVDDLVSVAIALLVVNSAAWVGGKKFMDWTK